MTDDELRQIVEAALVQALGEHLQAIIPLIEQAVPDAMARRFTPSGNGHDPAAPLGEMRRLSGS